MVLILMRMKVPAAKRRELSQTISLLFRAIRMEKGCRRCDFLCAAEDENTFCVLQEWDTRKDLAVHQKSDNYRVLRGAMTLLDNPCEAGFYSRLHSGVITEYRPFELKKTRRSQRLIGENV